MWKIGSGKIITTALLVALTSGSNLALAAKDIRVGHLTYQTGEYGSFGAFFDGITDFTVDVINENPPLGRNLTVIHEDIGTIGEARAARNLMNKSKVDVLLNPAHNYESYRKILLKRIKLFKGPLLPSVHGGAIDAQYGGTASEPLFRGSPMDSAQAVAALLHLKEVGKQKIVFVATTDSGHAMQADAGLRAAEKLGLDVIGNIEIQPDWSDYTAVAAQIDSLGADAVIAFTAPRNGGSLLRNAAEAGYSWFVVGTTEWQDEMFAESLTTDALVKHKAVLLSAYTHDNTPAWTFYESAANSSAQAAVIGDVANSYALQYYDLLVVTALAIEKAGSLDAKDWAAAMYSVTGGDGETVYTYADGIKALRAGKEINYDGVTGSMEYTDTGVVAGLFGIFRWNENLELERVGEAAGNRVAELDQE